MTQTSGQIPEIQIEAPPPPPVQYLELVPLGSDHSGVASPIRSAPNGRSIIRRYAIALILLWLPIAGAALYFGFIASDIYVSQAQFVIRSPVNAESGNMGMLMRGETNNRAADETHAVNAYMLSRDAARELALKDGLAEVMARPEADIFARYPNLFRRTNEEQFYRTYKRLVDVEVDASTGISTLEVHAYRPEDARKIAAALLEKGEAFVNNLRERSNQDELSFTRMIVDEARDKFAKAEKRLAEYRNQEGTINPEVESSTALKALAKLSGEISLLEAGLAQQMAMAASSPSIAPMREKIKSLRDELERQKQVLVGNDVSMAAKFQNYDLLALERELAARTLVAAVVQMEKARQETQRQLLYLHRIVEPNLPDQATLPYRFLGFLAVSLLALALYWIALNFLRLTLEHRA